MNAHSPDRPRNSGLALLVAGAVALAAGASTPAQQTPDPASPEAPQEPRPAEGEAPAGQNQRPLYIDEQHDPTITIAWPQRDGTRVELTRTLPWGTKNDRVELGENLLAFAAVGGTRIDLQQGHPLGSVVRVGFYKADKNLPFFADIQPGGVVEVRLEGVRFLEPAAPTTGTILQHLQYSMEDVLNCGLDASAIDQYNTARADDTLGGAVTEQNGRPGVLRLVRTEPPAEAPRYFRRGEPAGDENPQPAERFATVRLAHDAQTGAIGIRAELPYELFRHVRDPWLRTEPGTFFEPTHFHVEFESLPNRARPGDEPPPENGPESDRPEAEVAGP